MEPRRPSVAPGFSRSPGPGRPALRHIGATLRYLGAALLAAGVATIWASRLASHTDVYLSEMGASDAPTPLLFNSALLVIAVGGILVAIGRSGIRSRVRWLGLWSISATLVFACLSIALASRVTCSPGCPVPFTNGSSMADVVHTLFATLGFAAVGLAIIQAAYAHVLRSLSVVSIVSGALIIVASGLGGLASVFRFRADLGGWLELAAATVALLWVIVFALVRVPQAVDAAGAASPGVAVSPAPIPAAAPPATS